MKIYNCVWCGCEVDYNDNDVCLNHFEALNKLRRSIHSELVKIDIKKRKRQWMMFEFSQKINKLIEKELEIDTSRRLIQKKVNGIMSDEDQRAIFQSLGIAV